MPFGGNDLMDQPLYVYEAFKIMTCTRIEVEIESHNRTEEQIKRDQKKWQKTR